MNTYYDIEDKCYPGGKGGAGVVHKIINQIPPHDTFISGFLGKCKVMLHKYPAKVNIGYEVNQSVFDCWNFGQRSVITPDNCSYQFKKLSFLSWGKQHCISRAGNAFIYLDPPYLPETIKSKMRYENHLDRNAHIYLLEMANKFEHNTAISHYPCELYDTMLADWRKIEYETMTRGGLRTEALYMNYSEPEILHDYSYYGKDKGEREMYAKRRKNLINKLKGYSPHELEMTMRSLAGVFPDYINR